MILVRKNAFQEDVSSLAAGSNIINYQCAVYAITISSESGAGVVSISDSNGYAVASRVEKVVLSTSQPTVTLSYPGGKLFTTGLSAIANSGSVDISVTYE
jgi:hypothetical protein